MILQSTDELEACVGNKYSLVIVAAKRACQLKAGHVPLAQEASPNPLSIALREIREGEISFQTPAEEDIAPAPRDMITELVTGTEFDLMDEEVDQEEGDAVDELTALLRGDTEDESEVEAEADTPDAADETEDDADDVEDAADEEEDPSDDEDEGSTDDDA